MSTTDNKLNNDKKLIIINAEIIGVDYIQNAKN